MIKQDFHMHTYFCDGKNSPEEMVISGIEKGLSRMGIVIHSCTDFDLSYCAKPENIIPFQQEIKRLKDKYKDKIKLYCGVEQDAFSTYSTKGFDYVIGSCHYFKVNGKFYPIDYKIDVFCNIIKDVFGGDVYSAAENYFETESDIVNLTHPDFIGHFDLITKYNEKLHYIDENNPRYERAYKMAVDKIIPYNLPFEINTGAISRGHRTTPYPSEKIYNYIKSKGGKFIINSDSHNRDAVAYEFDKWSYLIY